LLNFASSEASAITIALLSGISVILRGSFAEINRCAKLSARKPNLYRFRDRNRTLIQSLTAAVLGIARKVLGLINQVVSVALARKLCWAVKLYQPIPIAGK
jgi:hypothetical protein